MNVSRSFFVGAILFSVMGTAAVYPFLLNVYVTNFPLDEEGNLRVSPMNGEQIEPPWKVINVVENYNLTWTPSLDPWFVFSDLIDLGSANVAGYSRMKVYMRVTNFTMLYQGSPNMARVQCVLSSDFEYGEIWRDEFFVYWYWDTTAQSLFVEFPQSSSVKGPMRETVEPSIRITIKGGSVTPNGPVLPSISCLVSIGIYLRNE